MGVMCNNSFLVQIKTQGYAVTTQEIEKIIKKRFGKYVSMYVSKYVPPPPKMKKPEPKLPKTPPLKTVPKFLQKPNRKGEVYCENCKYYQPVPKYVSRNNQDHCDCESNIQTEIREATYRKPRHYVEIGHILLPVEKNANNGCSDYIKKIEEE